MSEGKHAGAELMGRVVQAVVLPFILGTFIDLMRSKGGDVEQTICTFLCLVWSVAGVVAFIAREESKATVREAKSRLIASGAIKPMEKESSNG
jgi:hypothetical protein